MTGEVVDGDDETEDIQISESTTLQAIVFYDFIFHRKFLDPSYFSSSCTRTLISPGFMYRTHGNMQDQLSVLCLVLLSFNIKHPTSNIQHPTFNIQHSESTSNFQLSTFNIQHSTFNFQLSTFNIQLSTFNFQLSTFNFQHSTLNSMIDGIM